MIGVTDGRCLDYLQHLSRMDGKNRFILAGGNIVGISTISIPYQGSSRPHSIGR